MLAQREEIVIVGGTAIKKETAILATNQGIVGVEVTSVVTRQPQQQQRPYLTSGYQNQRPAIGYESGPEGCCEDCFCCRCESGYEWYSCKGKGPCMVLLLFFMYTILFTVGLPFMICLCLFYCLGYFFGCIKDDD